MGELLAFEAILFRESLALLLQLQMTIFPLQNPPPNDLNFFYIINDELTLEKILKDALPFLCSSSKKALIVKLTCQKKHGINYCILR